MINGRRTLRARTMIVNVKTTRNVTSPRNGKSKKRVITTMLFVSPSARALPAPENILHRQTVQTASAFRAVLVSSRRRVATRAHATAVQLASTSQRVERYGVRAVPKARTKTRVPKPHVNIVWMGNINLMKVLSLV
jgi:hypothetical protein